MVKTCVYGVLLCLGAISEISVSETSPRAESLTLTQAIDIALRKNPSQAIALHTERSARQNYVSQGSPVNPCLTYSGLNNTVAPFEGFGNISNYALYLTLETSGRWRYRSDQAKWEYVAAKEGSLGARIGLIQGVTSAYIALQVAKADLESEQLAWNDAKELANLTSQQVKLGAAPETNGIRAAIALKQEDQNLIRAESAVALARQTLRNQLGLDPSAPVDSRDPLTYDVANLEIGALENLALKNRYEIRSGVATEKSLESAVGLNRANFFPDVIVGAGLQGPTIQIGLTIPLDLGSIKGSVSKAKEDLLVQKSQDEKQKLEVRLDVDGAYENLVAAQRVVDSFRNEELPQAESLYEKVSKGYALGASTILDVLDAQSTLRTARTGMNDAIGAYNTDLSQLLSAVGLPLNQIKSQAGAPPNSAPAQRASIAPTGLIPPADAIASRS